MTGRQGPADGGEPAPAWVRDDPAAVPAYALARAGAAMSAVFGRQLGTVGLTQHTFVVLVHLAREPVLTSAELARRLELTPQSMSALLRGLAEAGWIERPDAVRRGQRVDVRITAAGRAALHRAGPVLAALSQPGALGLTAEEAAQLHGLLERVLRALAGHQRPGR